MNDNMMNNAITRPPFGARLKAFLKALQAYIAYCLNPKPTYGNKPLKKPNWHIARAQIEEKPKKPNENAFDMRARSFANIARTNAKLKYLKKRYKFGKNWDKRILSKKVSECFWALF